MFTGSDGGGRQCAAQAPHPLAIAQQSIRLSPRRPSLQSLQPVPTPAQVCHQSQPSCASSAVHHQQSRSASPVALRPQQPEPADILFPVQPFACSAEQARRASSVHRYQSQPSYASRAVPHQHSRSASPLVELRPQLCDSEQAFHGLHVQRRQSHPHCAAHMVRHQHSRSASPVAQQQAPHTPPARCHQSSPRCASPVAQPQHRHIASPVIQYPQHLGRADMPCQASPCAHAADQAVQPSQQVWAVQQWQEEQQQQQQQPQHHQQQSQKQREHLLSQWQTNLQTHLQTLQHVDGPLEADHLAASASDSFVRYPQRLQQGQQCLRYAHHGQPSLQEHQQVAQEPPPVQPVDFEHVEVHQTPPLFVHADGQVELKQLLQSQLQDLAGVLNDLQTSTAMPEIDQQRPDSSRCHHPSQEALSAPSPRCALPQQASASSSARDSFSCALSSPAAGSAVVGDRRWPCLPLPGQMLASSPPEAMRAPMAVPPKSARVKFGVTVAQVARSPAALTREAHARQLTPPRETSAVALNTHAGEFASQQVPMPSGCPTTPTESTVATLSSFSSLASSSVAGVDAIAGSSEDCDVPPHKVEQAIAQSLAAGGEKTSTGGGPFPCTSGRGLASIDSECDGRTSVGSGVPTLPSTSSSAVLVTPTGSASFQNASSGGGAPHRTVSSVVSIFTKPDVFAKHDVADSRLEKSTRGIDSTALIARDRPAVRTSPEWLVQRFVVTHDASVTVDVPRDSKEVARLPPGVTVEALEVLHVEAEHRLRARIKVPPGWISLRNTLSGFEWARAEVEDWPPQATNEKAPERTDVDSLGSGLTIGNAEELSDELGVDDDVAVLFSTPERRSMWLSIHDVSVVCQEMETQDSRKQNLGLEVRTPGMRQQFSCLPVPHIPVQILEIIFSAYDPTCSGVLSVQDLRVLLQDMKCTSCCMLNRQKHAVMTKAQDNLAAVAGGKAAEMMFDAMADIMDFELEMAKADAATPVPTTTVRRVHRQLDADGDGTISPDDFRKHAASVLFNPSPPEDVKDVAQTICTMMDIFNEAGRQATPGLPGPKESPGPRVTVAPAPPKKPCAAEQPKTLTAILNSSPKAALRPPKSSASAGNESSELLRRVFGRGGGGASPQIAPRQSSNVGKY